MIVLTTLRHTVCAEVNLSAEVLPVVGGEPATPRGVEVGTRLFPGALVAWGVLCIAALCVVLV